MSQGFTKSLPTPLPVNLGGTGTTTSTGTGSVVLSNSPTLVTPTLGIATATSLQFSPTTNGIIGVTDGSHAAAGQVGEYIEAVVVSIPLITNTPNPIASINLPAGEWEITFNINFSIGATTNITQMRANTSNTSGLISGLNAIDTSICSTMAPFVPGSSIFIFGSSISRRSLTSATPIYLNAQATFTISTVTATALLLARRVR